MLVAWQNIFETLQLEEHLGPRKNPFPRMFLTVPHEGANHDTPSERLLLENVMPNVLRYLNLNLNPSSSHVWISAPSAPCAVL